MRKSTIHPPSKIHLAGTHHRCCNHRHHRGCNCVTESTCGWMRLVPSARRCQCSPTLFQTAFAVTRVELSPHLTPAAQHGVRHCITCLLTLAADVVGAISVGHHCGPSLGAISGGHHWGPSLGAIIGGHQWGPSVGAISRGHQWGPSAGVGYNSSGCLPTVGV
jgi:hypothetical protein